MTASPLTKVWASAFEGMLLTPLDLLALEDMKFCINTQCLLTRGIPISIVHKEIHEQLSLLSNMPQ